jgi:tRNA dimethylallyltransferase
MTDENNINLVVIMGPTAVGKTALGVSLCRQFNGEIISADSRQFYRAMDIGTAKPAPEELAAVKHHLVDIADPDETVGLAQFLKLARDAIHTISESGAVPFLVGGTGQYIKAIVQGWQVPEIPPDPELRQRLEQLATENPEALWDELMARDPDAVEFIDQRNIRRIIRALEVCIKSNLPYSAQRKRIPPPYRILQIGLSAERESLYARADQRVDKMMEKGLPAEVEHLLASGYSWSFPAMSGLGYSQFRPYFEGSASLDDIVQRIKLDTHAFIRRQYTWFRSAKGDLHWLDIQDTDFDSQASKLVRVFLSI